MTYILMSKFAIMYGLKLGACVVKAWQSRYITYAFYICILCILVVSQFQILQLKSQQASDQEQVVALRSLLTQTNQLTPHEPTLDSHVSLNQHVAHLAFSVGQYEIASSDPLSMIDADLNKKIIQAEALKTTLQEKITQILHQVQPQLDTKEGKKVGKIDKLIRFETIEQ